MSRYCIVDVRCSPKDDIPIAGPKMSLALVLCNAPGWEIGSDRIEKGKQGKAYVSCKPLFLCSCQLILISGLEDPCNPVLRFHVMTIPSGREASLRICFRYPGTGGNYVSRDPLLIRARWSLPTKDRRRVQAAASSRFALVTKLQVASCKLQTRIVISLSITLASHHEQRQTSPFRGSESLQAGRDTATIHLAQPRQLVHKCSIRQCYRFTACCSSEHDRSNCSVF
jgi:hypothetical protein